MSNLTIIRNAPLAGNEIEQLRSSIHWESNKGKYDLLLDTSYAHFSIKDGELLVAFARVISDGVLYSFIVDLMVHPDYQSQGVGKKIVDFAIAELKAKNIKYIQLTFDPYLESFYNKLGFEIIKAGSIKNY
jgi:ribosomal protein S18 acetylase RimI-like enzyme